MQRAAHAGQAPQQGGGDDGDGSDRLDVHAGGGTDGGPAEAQRRGVSRLGDEQSSSDLQEVRQIQNLSAAHKLLQSLRKGNQRAAASAHESINK